MSGGAVEIEVVPIERLNRDEGTVSGYSHVGFDDHPRDAPGHLDFDPLLLFAIGEIQPGRGFAMHRHENIENIDVIFDGRARFEDSLGNEFTLDARETMAFSAGSGAEHSAFAEGPAPVRAATIWIRPERLGGAPVVHRSTAGRVWDEQLRPLVSGRREHAGTALPLRRDATLFGAVARPQTRLCHEVAPGRRLYLTAADAPMEVNGRTVGAGDRVLAHGHGAVEIAAHAPTVLLLLDLDRP